MSSSKSAKVRNIVELVSAAAVLLGLVFVGLELRQNTSMISAQATYDLNESANTALLEIIQDPELADLILKGNGDPASLNESELHRYHGWVRIVLNIHEAAWLYFKKGLISEDEFVGWKGSFCRNTQPNGVIEYWNGNAGSFVEGFRDEANTWCQT